MNYEVTVMRLTMFCKSCSTLIHKGELVKKYDGATFEHETCRDTPFRRFAAHKAPASTISVAPEEE